MGHDHYINSIKNEESGSLAAIQIVRNRTFVSKEMELVGNELIEASKLIFESCEDTLGPLRRNVPQNYLDSKMCLFAVLN